ncbi:MAG: hypothetical protein E7232_06685 [Lachnospiraceae bacterium]|nr:hypothetical protein [Lachnospiraceae bacterium]
MEGLSEFTSVYTLKLDISVNARNLDEAIIINNARMHDLRNALLHILADGVNILSENTEPTK